MANTDFTPTLKVRIDGETVEFDHVSTTGWDGLLMADIGRADYYLAEDSESAGKAAREYWEDMAENDPKEFTCMVGEETLIQWGLGRSAGPGYTHVRSLEEWLDLWLNTPEEQWASYDSAERAVTLDYEDYLDDAKEALGSEQHTEEALTAKATELMEQAEQDFRDEYGFFPTVAYRHN